MTEAAAPHRANLDDANNASENKAALRARLSTLRAREAAQMPKAGEALAYRFPERLLARNGQIVSAYAPMRHEIEPGGVLARCRHAGARLALPVTIARGARLIFREWDFGQPLERDAFGIPAPSPTAPEVEPDLVLCPLLAWDQDGGRLGYGAGFYDRTLAALRATKAILAVGLAYEIQRLEQVPMHAHDQRLDWIVTESAAYEAAPPLE